MSLYSTEKLISQARTLATEYRKTTGKPLGISSEIAEFDAAHILGLELVKDPSAGYNAIGQTRHQGKRFQIKGRVIFDGKKSGQRIGQLKLEQTWDYLVVVIMNEEYQATELYEAKRDVIIKEAENSQPSKRSKRGAISVAKFKKIANLVWCQTNGLIIPRNQTE